ncbi:MAG: hypothetical protein ACOH5I_20870 [Oligoflexus sp.]
MNSISDQSAYYAPIGLKEKLNFLQDPHNWPDATKSLQIIKTHMSIIFLTDNFAYKMKQPLFYAPADYRQLSQRKFACEEELRLNKVLAPTVYHGLVRLYCRNQEGLSFDPGGYVVEYLIQMRRLNDADTLRDLIRSKSWKSHTVKIAAKKLLNFYQQQSQAPLSHTQHIKKLNAAIQENLHYFLQHNHTKRIQTAKEIHGRLDAFIKHNIAQFAERQAQVIEGHGDLRAEHIYLEDDPVIIDRLEFSTEYRYVDILEDLALLSIDCESLGDIIPATIFLDMYLQTGRYSLNRNIWNFYRAHRAFTWSRLAAWHIDKTEGSQQSIWQNKTDQRLHLALHDARKCEL